MPSPHDIRETVRHYVKLLSAGDADGIIALFAEDPTVEDPVGVTTISGRQAVRDFYAGMSGKLQVQLTGPIRVAGTECAFPMLARAELGGPATEMDVIDVMAFDDDGKIASMRAFWNPGEMRPAS